MQLYKYSCILKHCFPHYNYNYKRLSTVFVCNLLCVINTDKHITLKKIFKSILQQNTVKNPLFNTLKISLKLGIIQAYNPKTQKAFKLEAILGHGTNFR